MKARRTAVALCVAASALAAACGGSTAVETVVGPEGVRCQTTLAGPSTALPPNGGTANVTVTAARDCAWAATSEAAWMQLGATSGQGNATIAVTVARNDVPSTRSGAIVVNNQRVTIAQEARPCSYELRAAPQSLSSDAGAGNITVETLAGCPWTAVSSAPWLRVVTASGAGPATIPFEVAANTGGGREASVTIGDRSITISQHAAQSGGGDVGGISNCGLGLTPTVINAPIAAGTFSVTVSANQPCEWRATSSATSWLTVAPASGRGPGTLTLSVARNTGNARSATVTVGEQVVTVNQAAMPACTVTLEPASASFPATGGNDGRVRVTTQDGCEWSLSNTPPGWVQQITPTRGTGTTDVRYVVAANTATSSRSTALTIGGRSHTITQQGVACSYQLEPPARSFPAGGGDGSVTVNTQSGCQWTPSGAPGWVTVSTDQRSGQGSLSYTVQANTGAARNGSISIGGQTHSISQEAVVATCTYSVQPPSRNFGHSGGEGRVTIVTQQNCAWQVSGGDGWAIPTTTSGTNQSELVYNVQANTTASSRTTTITVNGAQHTVTQDAQAAPTCSYTLSSNGQNFPHTGGSTTFTVTTQSGCTWSARSNASWASASTSGNTVSVTVQPNTGGQRQTTIAIEGQGSGATFNVSQDAQPAPTCTYSISASPQNFAHGGGPGTFTVTTQANCAWTASAGAPWLGGPWSGSGPQTVTISAQPNTTTAARQTAITLNTGPSVSITQDAPPPTCTYSISASPQNFAHGGGPGTFTVTTQANCAWTASAGAPWLGGPWSGSGPQTVTISAQPNTTTAARQTAITLNTGPSVTITQDAPPAMQACTYSISPGTADFGERGGPGTVQVTASSSTCAWTASESADWITLASTGGTGTAALNYTVSAHGGDDRREATITVAGLPHRVRQEGDDDDDDLLASYPLVITFIA